MNSEEIQFSRTIGGTEEIVIAYVVDGVVEVSEQYFIILMEESGWKLNEQGTTV